MDLNFFLQNWSDASNNARTELVFEGRDKKFGAYILRKEYPHRLLIAFLVTASLLATAVLIPVLLREFKKENLSKLFTSEEISLAEPPSIDKLTPPPPPIVLPPPVQKTIRFTPPVVVKEEVVEDPPPTQEQMENVQVSTVTQEGTTEEILPPENPVVQAPEEDKIFTIVEEMPSFPGGEKKMSEFILSHIHYPPAAMENNITGKVYVKFMVDKEGKIEHPELLKGIGGGCDEEAVRILKMMPDWNPGKQNGYKVNVGGIVLHIDFTLR